MFRIAFCAHVVVFTGEGSRGRLQENVGYEWRGRLAGSSRSSVAFFFTPFLVRKDTFEGSRTHCLHVIGNVKDGFVSLVDKNE